MKYTFYNLKDRGVLVRVRSDSHKLRSLSRMEKRRNLKDCGITDDAKPWLSIPSVPYG